ncbi:hypothetical protein, partial [Salmonella enterica]|uniref:hypothetical protein n=1 Tax=Salmonella enterica TaxID=28901 RepID=UPI001BCED3FA
CCSAMRRIHLSDLMLMERPDTLDEQMGAAFAVRKLSPFGHASGRARAWGRFGTRIVLPNL